MSYFTRKPMQKTSTRERSLKPRARPINISVLFLCKYCIVIMCFISFVSVWLCWGAPTYRIHLHIVLNSTFYLIDVGNFDFCFGFGVLCSGRVFFEWFVYLNTNEYNRVINGGAISASEQANNVVLYMKLYLRFIIITKPHSEKY